MEYSLVIKLTDKVKDAAGKPQIIEAQADFSIQSSRAKWSDDEWRNTVRSVLMHNIDAWIIDAQTAYKESLAESTKPLLNEHTTEPTSVSVVPSAPAGG